MSREMDDSQYLANKTKVLGKLPVFERYSLLSDAIQKLKDKPYEDKKYTFQPMYKIGDEVVVCSEIYFFAKIQSIKTDFKCPELKKLIPSYGVIYRDWNLPENGREIVAEYDVLAVSGPRRKPLEMFLAYHWNRIRLKTNGAEPKRKGAFFLDDENYKAVEKDVNKQFSDAFAGVNVGDFKSWLDKS